MLIDRFRDEVESLYMDEFKQFTREAIDIAPTWQYDEYDIQLTKEAYRIAQVFCRTLEVDDYSHDVVLTATLLHSICKYDQIEGERTEDRMHMFHVRAFLSGLQSVIDREAYNNLMILIESQKGFQSPIPQVMPKIDDPVHLWVLPLCINLAENELGGRENDVK